MKIIDYPKSNKISITPTQLLKVVKKLGIKAPDVNYDLTENDINLLKNSRAIYVAQINEEAMNSVRDVITDREIIIDDYKKILKDPNLTSEDKAVLEENLKEITADKKSLNGFLKIIQGKNSKGIGAYERGSGLDSSLIDNFVAQQVVENQDLRMHRISGQNELLAQENSKLASLKSREYRTEFKKKANEARQKAVQARIAKLQTKDGKIKAKQKKIINRNLNRYLAKSERKFKKQEKVARREFNFVSERTEYINATNKTQDNINILDGEIEKLKAGNLIDKVRSINKRMDRGLLKIRLTKLKNKKGWCEFKSQVARDIRDLLTIKTNKSPEPTPQQPEPVVQQPEPIPQQSEPTVKQPEPTPTPANISPIIDNELISIFDNRMAAIATLKDLVTQKESGADLNAGALLNILNNSSLTDEEKDWIDQNLVAKPGDPIMPLDSSEREYLEDKLKESEAIKKFKTGISLSDEEKTIILNSPTSKLFEKELIKMFGIEEILDVPYNPEVDSQNNSAETSQNEPSQEHVDKLYDKYINNFGELTLEEIEELMKMPGMDWVILQTRKSSLLDKEKAGPNEDPIKHL